MEFRGRGLALVMLSAIFTASSSAAEVVRSGSAKKPVGQYGIEKSEEDLHKIGKVSSPFPACASVNLIDSDLHKKFATEWRRVSMSSGFSGPIEIVPSTSMFKSFDVASSIKPGMKSPAQFLESVGQRAIYDLNAGLQQYRDLKMCIEAKDASVICGKLRDGFVAGFQRNGQAMRDALARSAFVDNNYVSRAIAMNDPSAFVNSRLEITKAGVFGVSSHRPLSGQELSDARADVRQEFDRARKEYLAMVERRLQDGRENDSWSPDVVDRERLRMTSPQALTAAVSSRMSDFRVARVGDYYRAMTESPQLAYATSAPKADIEKLEIIGKMIADGERQLERTREALDGAKRSQSGKITKDHLTLAGYSSTIDKILADEAESSRPLGRPLHCGMATGLHNELLSSQAANGLLIAGALVTAPIGAAIAVPRLAIALGAGAFASGTGLTTLIVGTGVSSGLLSAGNDIVNARNAMAEVRTGLRSAEDARDAVSAGNVAVTGVATSVALGLKPTWASISRSAARSSAAKSGSKVVRAVSNAKVPATIQETVGQAIHGKVMDVARLRTSLKLVKGNDKSAAEAFSRLDDGIYIYGVDKNGNAGLIPRNLDPGGSIGENSTFIGSHLGLRVAMKDALGQEINFVSAGEVIVRNGRTMAVTNGAGSFKNGTEHLEFGVQQLRQRGLKIDGRTEIRDYSKNVYEDPHDIVSTQVPLEIKVQRDPALRSLHQETSGLVAKVDAKGVSTGDELFEKALELDGVDSTAAYHAASLYRRWQNPAEGTAYSLEGIYRHIGPENYREALNVIRRLGGE